MYNSTRAVNKSRCQKELGSSKVEATIHCISSRQVAVSCVAIPCLFPVLASVASFFFPLPFSFFLLSFSPFPPLPFPPFLLPPVICFSSLSPSFPPFVLLSFPFSVFSFLSPSFPPFLLLVPSSLRFTFFFRIFLPFIHSFSFLSLFPLLSAQFLLLFLSCPFIVLFLHCTFFLLFSIFPAVLPHFSFPSFCSVVVRLLPRVLFINPDPDPTTALYFSYKQTMFTSSILIFTKTVRNINNNTKRSHSLLL